ncbi:glutathione S-transferase family protein [Dyella terrae]|uniref:glutathione S-transferase family protein n=1 Tax=Dyella terrae TaxID=522259 RepID=UPI001EFE6773|nr:glutathione S-transferase family protein [Dyella terrae]
MELIGMLDSPYVRRAAISLRMLGIPFQHRSLSVFRNFDEFEQINPLVKAPTLVGDDGELLVDSSLIIEWAESVRTAPSLMPVAPTERLQAWRLIGMALTASEKSVQIVYEHKRVPERRDSDWLARVEGQLRAAYDMLELHAAAHGDWLVGDHFSQADLSTAVAWRFTQLVARDTLGQRDYPALRALSLRAEQLSAFQALPPE